MSGFIEVIEFVREEVTRQGFSPDTYDWHTRVGWMMGAWGYAQAVSNSHELPIVSDMIEVAKRVEPGENFHGYRTSPVYIGVREAAPAELVPRLVSNLWAIVDDVKPGPLTFDVKGYQHTGWVDPTQVRTIDDFYIAFELIHPFGDGNGRTGKIIWNWLMGTLDAPVLVDDYFGHGNP